MLGKKNGRVRVATITKVLADRGLVFAYEAETQLIFGLHKKTYGRVMPDRKYALPKIHISAHGAADVNEDMVGKTVVFIEGEPSGDGKLRAERWAFVGEYAKRAFGTFRVSLVMEGLDEGLDFSPLTPVEGVTLWQLAEKAGYDIHLTALETSDGSMLLSEMGGLKWERYKPDAQSRDGGTWVHCADPRSLVQEATKKKRKLRSGLDVGKAHQRGE